MLITERSYSSPAYRYGFNGKGENDEINVDAGDYDLGARIYDSRLGRWWNIDPCNQFRLSPYLYFANNPILLNDINRGWVPSVDEQGNIILTPEEGDDYTTLIMFFGGKKIQENIYQRSIFPEPLQEN